MTLIKSISGIRGTIGGTVGENLTPVDAVKYASAYGTFLKIRNLGFSSLAVESNAEEGYLNKSTYTTYDNNKVVPAFDQGAETGFMGVNVHGNLHMSGNLKIFSYNCSGTAGSRC